MRVEYEPGGCNIGTAERRVRYGLGFVGFVAAAVLVGAVLVLAWPRWVLLLMALPLFAGFVGYAQGRAGFCVRYAAAGVYNVGDGLGEVDRVTDAAATTRDRRQARTLLVRSALATAVVTLAVYGFAPHL